MKKIFFTLFVLACAAVAKAQTTDVITATLQHGDEVSIFKGASAFVNAHAAAVDGDIITLSNGIFNTTTITKSISVYGMGVEENEAIGTKRTTINGDLYIGTAGEAIANIHLEGLYVSNNIFAAATDAYNASAKISRLTMVKCLTGYGVYLPVDSENLIFKQCRFGNISLGTSPVHQNLQITNCFINGAIIGYNANSDVVADHCIQRGYLDIRSLEGAGIFWKNSIFAGGGSYGFYGSCGKNCVVKNCIHFDDGYGNGFGDGTTTENVYVVTSESQIFADQTNAAYTMNSTFELQQPDVWVATDGTQIGPNGGEGWNKVPGIPVVKSLELGVEGDNLNVTYEAEAR